MLLLLVACTQSPPSVDEPAVTYVSESLMPRYPKVQWDGRHELLVLPAEGAPIEVPRQWQRPVPDHTWPIAGPLENVPVVAIDAARPWREVCPHLRGWQARAGQPLQAPEHLEVQAPPSRSPVPGGPPPPPPPPPIDPRAAPCRPLKVALGPAYPFAPDIPEYPVLYRALASMCTGEGPEDVLFEARIAAGAVTVTAAGQPLAAVEDLQRRLRAAREKDVRIAAIAADTPWEEVQSAYGRILDVGASSVWFPLDCAATPTP
ncbi:MAG: hypothetical protein R3F61_33730 [Myxococcota bacterium]